MDPYDGATHPDHGTHRDEVDDVDQADGPDAGTGVSGIDTNPDHYDTDGRLIRGAR